MDRKKGEYNDDLFESFSDSDEIDTIPQRTSDTSSGKSAAKTSAKKRGKKKHNVKLIMRNSMLVLFAVLLAVCGTGFIYYYNTINSLNFDNFLTVDDDGETDVDTEEYAYYDTDIVGGTMSMDLSGDSLLNDPMVLNVMLFGEDKTSDGVSRSDTMIMLSIDNRHKKLKLTSFMRDLWVYIPDYGYSRLNSAYAYGGAQLAISTIEQNFGVNIDRYAIVDYDSFKSIIDVLGGIDIELTDEEIDYINWQSWTNGQVDTRYEITDSAGIVHLNGRQALWYARDRGDADAGFSGDDYDRTARQRNLLKTLATDMKSASLTQIINIVNEIGPLITTNLKQTEITTLVLNSLTYLSYDMEEYQVPSDGNHAGVTYYGMAVLDITDWDLERQNLAAFLYEDLITESSSYTGTYGIDADESEYTDEYGFYY